MPPGEAVVRGADVSAVDATEVETADEGSDVRSVESGSAILAVVECPELAAELPLPAQAVNTIAKPKNARSTAARLYVRLDARQSDDRDPREAGTAAGSDRRG